MPATYDDDGRDGDAPVSPSLFNSLMAFSLPVGRITGVPTRVNWTLLLAMALAAIDLNKFHQQELIPWGLTLLPLIVWMRATLRVAVVRLVGGNPDAAMLWMFGDMTRMTLPLRPGAHFAVGICGVLLDLMLLLGFFALGRIGMSPYWAEVLILVMGVNLGLLKYNLLPCLIFDGARWWRGALWPLFGVPRAVRITIIGAYVASVALTLIGCYYLFFGNQKSDTDAIINIVFGVSLFVTTINEDRLNRAGYDLVLQTDPRVAKTLAGGRQSWFAAWSARRRERAAQQAEQAQAQEQIILDELLAKVSANGLPSLSARERKILQNISKSQKKRLGET